MSSVGLLRASSFLARQTRGNAALTAPFPPTKKLCPLLTPHTRTTPLSSFSSFSPVSSFSSPSPFPFFSRAYGTLDDSDRTDEDSFNDSDDSENPFNTSDDDWVKEQDSDVEESEFELGGRTIPAKTKPYPLLETNFLIRQLQKEANKDQFVPDDKKVKNVLKGFLDSKNNENLNKIVDEIDETMEQGLKTTAQQKVKEFEALRDFKIQENARLAALPKPFGWTPDVEDTGPVYDPARSGSGLFPPVIAPVEEVADFYLRLHPSLYPFRDVIVYKIMQKAVEANEWYEHTIPQFSEVLKRAKNIGLFDHFAGLEDEESVVREIAASQGLSLEEWGNADLQIKALKHQRAACFWDPPFDTMIPIMQDIEDLVTALENEHPGQSPILDLEKAIIDSANASDACGRFLLNLKQMNHDIQSRNILPRQFAVQMENALYPGMYQGHLAHQDWSHNPWVQQTAHGLSEEEKKVEFEMADRLIGRLPSFVYSLNQKLESLSLPKDAFVEKDGERIVDPVKASEHIERFIKDLTRTEIVELNYMLTRPKDSKERRCLNYLSSFFNKHPHVQDGQTLFADNALLFLVDRQKEILRIKKLQKDQENPFTNFESQVGIEGYAEPDPTLESFQQPDSSEPSVEPTHYYNSAESAYTLNLTPSEAQHLTEHGITLEETEDRAMDELMLEVEHEMEMGNSSNIEDGFEWDRTLMEQRMAQTEHTEAQHDKYLDKSWRNRFPGSLLDHYKDHMEKDIVLIDRKALKPKQRDCLFCVMENPPKLEPWNVPLLSDLVDEVGNIRSRRETGFCPKHQRQIAPVLRRAVQLGFFSYKKGEFTVIDPFRPMPWKAVQHGLYPEDIMEALEDMDEEEGEQFMDAYNEENKENEDPVQAMENIEMEASDMRYVPGNFTFKKRKQTFPQWGK